MYNLRHSLAQKEWGDPVHNPEAGQGLNNVNPPFPKGDVPFKLVQWGDPVHNPEAGQGKNNVTPPFPTGDVPFKLA